jgi:hypothetical protein
MKTLRHWLVARFYPGTLEEFYAAREIQRRERRVYRRQTQFIVGAIAIIVPALFVVFSGILRLRYAALLLLAIWGVGCIRETIEEHYTLQMLRRERASSEKT